MSAKEPRGVQVAFSTAYLETVGVDDDEIDDYALAEITDDFILTFSREFTESVRQWLEDHQEDE